MVVKMDKNKKLEPRCLKGKNHKLHNRKFTAKKSRTQNMAWQISDLCVYFYLLTECTDPCCSIPSNSKQGARSAEYRRGPHLQVVVQLGMDCPCRTLVLYQGRHITHAL